MSNVSPSRLKLFLFFSVIIISSCGGDGLRNTNSGGYSYGDFQVAERWVTGTTDLSGLWVRIDTEGQRYGLNDVDKSVFLVKDMGDHILLTYNYFPAESERWDKVEGGIRFSKYDVFYRVIDNETMALDDAFYEFKKIRTSDHFDMGIVSVTTETENYLVDENVSVKHYNAANYDHLYISFFGDGIQGELRMDFFDGLFEGSYNLGSPYDFERSPGIDASFDIWQVQTLDEDEYDFRIWPGKNDSGTIVIDRLEEDLVEGRIVDYLGSGSSKMTVKFSVELP